MKFTKLLLSLLSILFALMYGSSALTVETVENTQKSLRAVGSTSESNNTEPIEVIPHAEVSSNTVFQEKNKRNTTDARAIAAVIMACVGGVGMIGLVATKMVNKRATSSIHRARRYQSYKANYL
jgi:uncharacterized protein HemX